MDNPSLWQSLNKAWVALRADFEPAVSQWCSRLDVDLNEWGLLLSVLKFEPQSTAPADLLVRSPYTAPDVFIERLGLAAKSGLLVETNQGAYRLTERGREVCLELIEVARKVMVEVDPLSQTESQRIATLTDRLVHESMDTPPPPSAWAIRLNYKLMPANRPEMPFIEQGFTCLSAYREDSQLASWISSGLSATALEMLALLWRCEVDSLDAICDRLAHRGHNCEVYFAVLNDLRERGFINGTEDSLYISAMGRLFCNQVEEETDRYFFAPWSCLNEDDKVELAELLRSLKDGLARKS